MIPKVGFRPCLPTGTPAYPSVPGSSACSGNHSSGVQRVSGEKAISTRQPNSWGSTAAIKPAKQTASLKIRAATPTSTADSHSITAPVSQISSRFTHSSATSPTRSRTSCEHKYRGGSIKSSYRQCADARSANLPSAQPGLDNGSLTSAIIAATTLRVPGSSANLGPGFDALGVALQVYLTCRFSPAPQFAIRCSGRDACQISCDENNLIWQTALTIATHANLALPPADLEITNEIPLGKGLGSSAAAITTGVIIAVRLLRLDWTPARILDEAARLEGHPDNVAACVLGSVVASAVEPEGHTRAIRLEMPPNFKVAVVVPNFALPTKQARAILPNLYTRTDVTFNIQRAVLLTAALATGDSSAFPTALDDRLHQPFRASLVPGLAEILALRAPGLLGCTLSGAGPAVLVFYESGHEHVCDLIREAFAKSGCTTEVIASGVAPKGYEFL
jgi:homoserine kinase